MILRNVQISIKSRIKRLKSPQVASSRSDLLDRPAGTFQFEEIWHQADSLFFLGRNMVLLYIRLVFMMPSHLDMDEILPGSPSTAPVVPGLPLNILLSSCAKGGFPLIWHNEICDLTANLLTEVGHEVQVEPYLQPITGEHFPLASLNIEDGAHLDILINGFRQGPIVREYFWMSKTRIREVEHATFTPLIFSATGGWLMRLVLL